MEKIDIAKLLKNCPKGMKLDCTTWENVSFEEVVNNEIYIKRNNKIPSFDNIVILNQYGRVTNHEDEKCRIFPKGKTTWEGFVPPCKFKDGDVVISTSNNIHLISCRDKNYGGWESCCGIIYDKFDSTKTVHVIPTRLSTEEEKQKLFDAIRENGYHWDTESKTLKNWTIQDAKDGDVISYGNGWTCIFKCIHGEWYSSYCFITSDGEFHTGYEEHGVDTTFTGNVHLASKEQCDRLFQKMKEAGYKWNLETKTLEKLTELKENTEDKTVMSGIYFNREDYADEVELHLNNYEIEIRDGRTYAIFKNQETKISKLKFKDGDVIVDKYGAVAIYKRVHSSYEEPYVDFHCGITSRNRSFFLKDSDSLQHCGEIDSIRFATEEEKEELFQAIKDNGYKWNPETKTLEKLVTIFKVGDKIKLKDSYAKKYSNFNTRKITEIKQSHYILDDEQAMPLSNQYLYELVSNKFDINTLKPFDKVLVRTDNKHVWSIQFFERLNNLKDSFVCMGGWRYRQCIPFEGNEHLLNTVNDCDDFYKTWEK